MTKEQWIDKYENKAEKFKLLPGFAMYFEPDKGFFCWAVINGIFEVDHSCINDIRYMDTVGNNIAKMYGCKLMRTAVFRDPIAYLRLYKGSRLNWPLSRVRANGLMYWIMEKEVKYD